MPLKPAAERGGERLCGDSSADPYPGSLEALLGEWEASQLHNQLWKQEQVRGCEIRRKERVGDKQDDAGGQPVLGGSSINDWKIFQPQISVKNGPDGKIR